MRPVSGSFFGGALKATLRPTSNRSTDPEEARLPDFPWPARKDEATVVEPDEGAAEPRAVVLAAVAFWIVLGVGELGRPRLFRLS